MTATKQKYLQFLICYLLSGKKNPGTCKREAGLAGETSEILEQALVYLQELYELEQEYPTDQNARTRLEFLTGVSFSQVVRTLHELLETGPPKVRWEISQVFLRNRGIAVDKQNTRSTGSMPAVQVFLQPSQEQKDKRKLDPDRLRITDELYVRVPEHGNSTGDSQGRE